MSVLATATLCAAAVTAAEPATPGPSDAPTRDVMEKMFKAEQHGAGPPVLPLQPAPQPLPRMRWDREVACGDFAPTTSVPSGSYRLQCDWEARACLVAPNHVLDASGVETEQELTRTQVCGPRTDWPDLIAQGFRFIPAVAEVQPGWVRDDRQRSMQYNFDMNRRLWLGAAYAPMLSQLDPGHHRGRADIGLEVESPSEDAHTLYRWHALDGELYFGSGVPSYDLTAVRLDWSTSRAQPLLFLTTFFGEPARHDLNLDVGAWFEAMHLEWLRRTGETESFLTLGAANLTADIWHSKDMVSYVRLRGGPAAELDTQRHGVGLKPEAALEGDLTLDADGFHHVRFLAEGEKVFFGPQDPARADANPERLRLMAGYEVIVVAVNDQPVTLVFDTKATYRDDFATVAPGWEWTGEVGIRFSLWAPARRSAPLLKTR